MTGRRAPRGIAAINAEKTCCDRGHNFDDRNTYRWTDPQTGWTRRYCRACRRDSDASNNRHRRPA